MGGLSKGGTGLIHENRTVVGRHTGRPPKQWPLHPADPLAYWVGDEGGERANSEWISTNLDCWKSQ